MARLIECVTGFGPDGALQVIKVILYTFKGNTSAIFIFASCMGVKSELKEFALLEQILSFKSRPHFKRAILSRKANWKTLKLYTVVTRPIFIGYIYWTAHLTVPCPSLKKNF